MNIGSVRADNIEDSDSHESIRLGFIKGYGLLGKVVAAVRDLVDAARNDESYSRLRGYCNLVGPGWKGEIDVNLTENHDI